MSARLLAQHGLDADHIDRETEAAARYLARTTLPPFCDTVQLHDEPAAPPAPRLAMAQSVARFGASTRQAEAARTAYRNGEEAGWRSGYISGMHWGMLVGAIATALFIYLLLEVSRIYGPGVTAWLGSWLR